MLLRIKMILRMGILKMKMIIRMKIILRIIIKNEVNLQNEDELENNIIECIRSSGNKNNKKGFGSLCLCHLKLILFFVR